MMEVRKSYWPNGKLRYECLYQNGKLYGIYKGWYESGQLAYEYSYQNGSYHGISKSWYENGQLYHEQYYLYGEEVSEEEYRRYELITKLAGISDEI